MKRQWLRIRSNEVAWNVAARGGGLLSAAVATWVVAKMGGATEVGIYALLRVLPATLGVLVAGGLPGAATYSLAGPSRDDRRVPLTVIAIAAAGGLGGVLLWLVATPLLHRVFFSDMATVLVAVASTRVFTYLVFSAGRASAVPPTRSAPRSSRTRWCPRSSAPATPTTTARSR